MNNKWTTGDLTHIPSHTNLTKAEYDSEGKRSVTEYLTLNHPAVALVAGDAGFEDAFCEIYYQGMKWQVATADMYSAPKIKVNNIGEQSEHANCQVRGDC